MAKFISMSSKDRSYGNINDFTIKLSDAIDDIRGIKSMQVSLPYQWYTVMTGINDKIYFEVGGSPYTATLTEGNYTSTTLATEVASAMNTIYLPDNLFTCTLSTLTYKYTITHGATNFTLEFGTNTTAAATRLLGYNAVDTSLSTSHEADNIFTLRHADTIFLKSRDLAQTQSIIGDNTGSFILPIPVTGNFGDIISWKSNGDDWFIHYRDDKGKTIPQMDFGLYFEDLTTLVPLNGLDWRISFRYIDSIEK